jgi:hypothetical protein
MWRSTQLERIGPGKRDERMVKIDLKKQFDYLSHPPTGKVVLVDGPEMNFLMRDGMGTPNTTQEYKDAGDAVYNLASPLTFMIKKGQALDYPVMPLEGLWWTKNRLESCTLAHMQLKLRRVRNCMPS